MNTGAREVLLAVASDITQRSEAEARLLESEALLIQSQRAAAVGHYVFAILGGVWTSSEVLDELFGIGADYPHDVDGWLRLVVEEDRGTMAGYLCNHVLGGKQEFNLEYRIARANDGALRWLHGLGRLELDKD